MQNPSHKTGWGAAFLWEQVKEDDVLTSSSFTALSKPERVGERGRKIYYKAFGLITLVANGDFHYIFDVVILLFLLGLGGDSRLFHSVNRFVDGV